jgi:hypothetical protein
MKPKEVATKVVLIFAVFVLLTATRVYLSGEEVYHVYALTIIGLLVLYGKPR